MLKDKKIDIGVDGEGIDDSGFPIHGFSPLDGCTNLWCYYRHLSGKEIFEANSEYFKAECIFVINYNTKVKPGHIILFRDKHYKITQVDDFEGYKGSLKLYAKITEL